MKRVRIAAVGAVLAAGLMGGSAFGANPGARKIVRCQALTAKVASINAARNGVDPNADPITFAILSHQLQRALAQQAAACA